jgi:hypothetical protein
MAPGVFAPSADARFDDIPAVRLDLFGDSDGKSPLLANLREIFKKNGVSTETARTLSSSKQFPFPFPHK